LGLPSGLFPTGFPTKTLYMPCIARSLSLIPCRLVGEPEQTSRGSRSHMRLNHCTFVIWEEEVLAQAARGCDHVTCRMIVESGNTAESLMGCCCSRSCCCSFGHVKRVLVWAAAEPRAESHKAKWQGFYRSNPPYGTNKLNPFSVGLFSWTSRQK
jgi:hypothetical protein